jgi:hypothetical protein
MALAVLFTHEGDWIYQIPPDAMAEDFAGVAAGIADTRPIYVTIDEGVSYVRATRTSQLESCRYDGGTGQVTGRLTGFADVDTHFQLFTDESGEIVRTLVPVPAFEDQTTVTTAV